MSEADYWQRQNSQYDHPVQNFGAPEYERARQPWGTIQPNS